MPNMIWKSDKRLLESFLLEEHKDDAGTELHVQCRKKTDEGEACPRAWAIDVNQDGTIDTGIRNALLSHAKAHDGGFKKMRRIA